jgi:hypothetical protein
VTFQDYAFFVPTDAAGSRAKLEGVVQVTEVKAEAVDHYESEGATFTNKDADGSAKEVRLVASGVELERGWKQKPLERLCADCRLRLHQPDAESIAATRLADWFRPVDSQYWDTHSQSKHGPLITRGGDNIAAGPAFGHFPDRFAPSQALW